MTVRRVTTSASGDSDSPARGAAEQARGGASAEADPRCCTSVLDCVIDALTFEQTVALVDGLIRAGKPAQAFLVNADTLLRVRDDDRLRAIVSRCVPVCADGQSVVWAARLLGKRLPGRVAGPDLFDALLALAVREAYSVYLLGAKPGIAEEAARKVVALHPGLKIVGTHHGYFDLEDVAVVDAVRRAHPDILFVGMPSPRKEYWVSENLDRLGVPFTLGVGGTFDVVAGVRTRAPMWMQRAGLEWVCRLCQEPRRMWRRYLVGNARFVALVVREFYERQRDRVSSSG